MVNYPSSLDVLGNPIGTDPTTGTLLHSVQHANANDILEALEAKLGLGAGGPSGAGGVLRQTAAGISGWGFLTNADIASLTIRGGADGAGGKIAAQSLANADIQDASINGGTKLLGSSVTTGVIAANAVTQTFLATAGPSVNFSTTGVWSFGNFTLTLSNLTLGSPVVYMLVNQAYQTVVGNGVQFGIGIDSTTSPSASSYISAPVANYYVSTVAVGRFIATATAHTLCEICFVPSGTTSRASGAILVAWESKR